MNEQHEQVRHMLAQVPHVAIATVNQDGSPHNTPVRGVFNDKLHLFWASSLESDHSKNIMRDGRAFVVVFDSRQGGAGLYLAGRAEPLEDETHVYYAYNLLGGERTDMDSVERYRGNGPQRLYRFVPEQTWTHRAIKDEDGYFITDKRMPVAVADIAP